MRTKVYEYIKKPLLCTKCLDYGHSKKVCQGSAKCRNCAAEEQHENCTNDKRCYHCSLNHEAGNKNCQEYKFEAEILAVQSKSRVSRPQARLIFLRENPTFRNLNFANVVKTNTSSLPSSISSVMTPTTTTPSTSSSSKTLSSTSSFKTPPSKTSSKTSITTTPARHPPNREILADHELTSQNNPVVRAEAKRLYDEFDSDRFNYEKQLTDCKTSKSTTCVPNRSRSRERSIKRLHRSYSKSKSRRHSKSRSRSHSRSRPDKKTKK